MIGTLGDIVFEVSSERVRTFESLSRTGNARYQQHDVISTKPVLEFIGLGIDAISLSVRLDAGLGVNPVKEMTQIRDYMRAGERLPLIIGGRLLNDFVIEQVDETWERVDNRGNPIIIKATLSLKESVE